MAHPDNGFVGGLVGLIVLVAVFGTVYGINVDGVIQPLAVLTVIVAIGVALIGPVISGSQGR